MKISQNCLELIKKWEAADRPNLEAYLCSAGIPMIGYETTRYPNGQKVHLGDKITEHQAEAFLKLECDEVAEEVSNLVSGISLNQNQFDALVSFCYDEGLGALTESTLLKKLKENDFSGAASEFEKWNKATISGVKTILPNLVARRKDERSLFGKQGGEGTPIEVEESPQDKVTWLEGYRDSEKNVIVAWNNSEVVEILTLESSLKDDLIPVLQQYKNAENLCFALAGKAIPSGERISVSGKGQPILKLSNSPRLNHPVLLRGMEGDDVKELQSRLNELGYDVGKVDGIFGKKTDEAVKDFQAKYFSLAEADGKVGLRTWEKLWGDVTSTIPDSTPPALGKNYLRLTKTRSKYDFGCYKLKLEYFKDGQFKNKIEVCSGQPNKQSFQKGSESIAMSYEPLPEGKWRINDISWADGKDNYDGKAFPDQHNGLGPVEIPLDYVEPGKTERSDILIHIDWNRDDGYPGTAGCIGVYSIADFKQLVSWLRETNPHDLFVDWGLGTCPQP